MPKKITIPDALWLMGLLWLVYGLELLLPINFDAFTLVPRQISSLPTIFSFHFIHHGFWHILANSIPFMILGFLVQLHGRDTYWSATVIIIVIGGIGTWLFSSSGRIAGASGLVFGYWAFLLAAAYYERSIKTLIIAIVVFIFYGTLVFGLLDFRLTISWAGHFWGLVGGIVASYCCFSKSNRSKTHSDLSK